MCLEEPVFVILKYCCKGVENQCSYSTAIFVSAAICLEVRCVHFPPIHLKRAYLYRPSLSYNKMLLFSFVRLNEQLEDIYVIIIRLYFQDVLGVR